jgi:hypothetical protein
MEKLKVRDKAVKDLEIVSIGSRPNKKCGILMDKEKIEIII